MTDPTIEALCKAVESSLDGDDDYAMETALVDLETALGSSAGAPVSPHAARAILAAIAEAEERGRREALDVPEVNDFVAGVVREAAHQRDRWGSGDAGKAPADWFWLLGYLGGKALAASIAGNTEKALHHCISSAAALANWHAALTGASTSMRPGIADPAQQGGAS